LGVAKGTFAPMFAGLKFFYVNTLGYEWPLFTKKTMRKPRQKRLPDVRSDADCRRLIARLEKPVYRGCFTLIYAYGSRISEAVSNARILRMDDTHVTYRWKDRNAGVWRTVRLPGVEFLRRFLEHVLPRGFHKVRYYGLWHHWKRDLSNRAWLLLILQKPTDAIAPLKIADLLEALSQLAQIDDRQDPGDENYGTPCCPHCGSRRTRLLAECPRFGVP
jgi:hypothetical protein